MEKYIHKSSLVRRARLWMMMFLLIVMSNLAFSQNITNPGFDVITQCPTGVTIDPASPTLSYAPGWAQATKGTADLYNTCGILFKPNSTTLSPQNGSGYVGIFVENNAFDYKEYITNELSAPLVQGVTYTISFYVAQGLGVFNEIFTLLNMRQSEKGFLGLCFSAVSPTAANTTNGTSGSIINNFAPTGRVYIPASHPAYTSNNTWVPVTLKYTATGGEKFMTLGQFRPGVSPSNGSGYTGNYYLFDSFSNTVQPNATLTKSVSPASISANGTATYTFTISNNIAGNVALSGLNFTDTLPSGLRISPTPNVTVDGLSGGTVTANAGGNSVTASGYSIAANTTATITVNVTNATGQFNPTCSSNPAAFTNSASNISNISENLTNSVSAVCLVVTPACNAGSTAPSVQNISNTCPSTTANLSTAHTGTTPAGNDLVWFTTNNPSTGTQLTATQVANAAAGTYYAFYKSTTVANCYSPASNPVTVTINSCPVLSCSGTANIPPSGTFTVNGVTVTSSYTGDVKTFSGGFTTCSSDTFTSASLYVGQTTSWSVTLNFNKPVNDLVLLLGATGNTANENFIFNSNGGAVSIYSDSPSNCASTISGNQIISGNGGPPVTGGGGRFKISATSSFTSLTINGAGGGGQNGSLMAFCSSSLVPICNAGTTQVPLNGSILIN